MKRYRIDNEIKTRSTTKPKIDRSFEFSLKKPAAHRLRNTFTHISIFFPLEKSTETVEMKSNIQKTDKFSGMTTWKSSEH